MVGTNRLWALRYLGCNSAPVIMTGKFEPDWVEHVEVSAKELPSYFKDGEPYLSPYGIAVRGNKKPELMEYPKNVNKS